MRPAYTAFLALESITAKLVVIVLTLHVLGILNLDDVTRVVIIGWP